MKTHAAHSFGMSWIIKRALEGRISPLNFLLILGFFSSIVLMYISLHVHFSKISADIDTGRKRVERLMTSHAHLMADYNGLTSHERIIPLAESMGLRPCSPGDVRRLALYDGRKQKSKEPTGLAQAGESGSRKDIPIINP